MNKPSRMTLIVACAATFLCLPTFADAQSDAQTPENAQRFLATVLPAEYRYTQDCTGCTWTSFAMASEVRSPTSCETYWDDDLPSGVRTADGRRRVQTGINWRNVVEVTQTDTIIRIKEIPGRGAVPNLWSFDLRSSDMAARAAFAMEVLRRSCDPTVGMGF
jgi:hypothetical protein